jgi:ribosomal protein S18 acetylase RimI-like enzyme
MTPLVREARPEDFEAVTALLEELGRPKALGTPDEAAVRERFGQWLDAPDRFVFVAEENGEVIGMIDLALIGRPNFVQPHAWVPDLIVREGARSRGVGAALLSKASEVAKELGAFSVALESAHWRTRAHHFYVRQGMTDAARHFIKVFADVPWPPPAAETTEVTGPSSPPDASAPGSPS